MNSEEFIERIRIAVYESTVEGSLSWLQDPPGGQPPESLISLSQWFRQLAPDDRQRIREVIQFATRGAVFSMLTVLDGVRSIRQANEKGGTLELRYVTDGRSVLLNDVPGEFLHDQFAQKVPLP